MNERSSFIPYFLTKTKMDKKKKVIIAVTSIVVLLGVAFFATLSSEDLAGRSSQKRKKKPRAKAPTAITQQVKTKAKTKTPIRTTTAPTMTAPPTITMTAAPTMTAPPTASAPPTTPAPPTPVCGDGNIDLSLGEVCDDGNLTNGDGCSSLCEAEAPPVPMGTAHVNITTPGGNSGFLAGGWLEPVTIETCVGNENDWIAVLQTYMIVDDRNFRLDRLPFSTKVPGPGAGVQDASAVRMTVSTDRQNWQGTSVGEYTVNNPQGAYALIETGGLELSANTTYYLTFSIQRNATNLAPGENYQNPSIIQTALSSLTGTNYGEFLPGGPTVGGLITAAYPNANMNVYQLQPFTHYTMTACSN